MSMTAAAGPRVDTFVDTFSRAVPARPATAHDIATGRDPQRVKIFDTTLRDGEQSPGATLTPDEKLIIAKQLAKLGVDVIEAGFPIASEGDFEAVRNIATIVGNREDPPIVCGLARALKADISRCWEAVKPAAFPRIHTFIATSEVHMEHKLRKTPEQVLAITTEMVSYAKSLCEDVEFSAEDAIRSDRGFLCEVFTAAIAAGATTINVPDTVGYTTPAEFADLIQHIRANVVGVDAVTISVHGHDDLGMAVANFLSAVENGARQMEVTINGIGERAGNASLEEVVMALHVRGAYYNERMGRDGTAALTNINQKEIYRTSRLVSNLTGMMVQPNKAIVGSNAFAHESGIHQDGVLKKRETYEIMDATSIGLEDNSIVLGKLSGRHAFGTRLIEMGYELSDEELQRAFVRFKEFADKKKEVSSLDLEAIVDDEVRAVSETIALRRVQVQCGDHCIPTATIQLYFAEADETRMASSTGTGPVDAAFQAVNEITHDIVDANLKEYLVNSVTKGIDALGEVTVRVEDNTTGRQYTGRSANPDVVVASAQAYINAINRCRLKFGSPIPIHPQHGKSV
jgi:2-isopropylmalate synthase